MGKPIPEVENEGKRNIFGILQLMLNKKGNQDNQNILIKKWVKPDKER